MKPGLVRFPALQCRNSLVRYLTQSLDFIRNKGLNWHELHDTRTWQ